MASNSSLSTSQVAKAKEAIDLICSLVFPTEQEGSSHSRVRAKTRNVVATFVAKKVLLHHPVIETLIVRKVKSLH